MNRISRYRDCIPTASNWRYTAGIKRKGLKLAGIVRSRLSLCSLHLVHQFISNAAISSKCDEIQPNMSNIPFNYKLQIYDFYMNIGAIRDECISRRCYRDLQGTAKMARNRTFESDKMLKSTTASCVKHTRTSKYV